MLHITKDIDICYDGIRSISLKEGQTLDVKALLPNPEKAKVFRDRLIELKVAKEAETEKPKEPKEEAAKEAVTEQVNEPESEDPEPKSEGKKRGKKSGKKA